ncbi:MAG: phosphatase PAP2 family protein [Clostridiales bacterium]|nr:phosphatase PAP2 family protein [Clostridiales bacterium]
MSRRKIWFIIVSATLFVLLAISIQAGIGVEFEGWIYKEAVDKMSPALTVILKVITFVGDTAMVITICLLFFVIPRTRKHIAFPVSLAVISSSILNIIMKNFFARERPDILRLINETSYSFPSGHALNNATLYFMLIWLIFKYVKNQKVKYSVSAILFLLIISIGFSRIYLGVHHAGDVLGGWLFGFSLSILVFHVWEKKLLNRKVPKT